LKNMLMRLKQFWFISVLFHHVRRALDRGGKEEGRGSRPLFDGVLVSHSQLCCKLMNFGFLLLATALLAILIYRLLSTRTFQAIPSL